ncbi:response regulator transcription factor [Mycobacterium sp. ITM-2016-00317]|uniref:response regulator transcription factor n=1 Tax=Mycobacterium sp. ITM-2016-00317 TaxID=2099694 RepID=UPI00287FC5A8|nr:response regulator transcription factor [Mycobacterium sp. ITM-2016-00317]WNG88453.1 response regulator transcription factor [Mycobacterium sp. ITM-2016-00317]
MSPLRDAVRGGPVWQPQPLPVAIPQIAEAAPSVGVAGAGSPALHDTDVLIIDDCTLNRENLAAVFGRNGAGTVGVAWDLPSLFTALSSAPGGLVLLNINTRDSVVLLHAVFEMNPHTRVIALGMAEDDDDGIIACAEAGVAGYHLRTESLDDLLTVMTRVARGEMLCSPKVSAVLLRRLSSLASAREPAAKELVLTAREVEILRLLEMGMSNRDIADRLCIAVHTVKNHVHSVLTKLGVTNRAEAAARFRTVRFAGAGAEN